MPPLIKAIPASKYTQGLEKADELPSAVASPPPAPAPITTPQRSPAAPAVSPVSPELAASTSNFITPSQRLAGGTGMMNPAAAAPGTTTAPATTSTASVTAPLRTWTGQVELWRPLVEQYDWPVDKVLHVINYESGGNPNIPGDGGAAWGGFQSHYIGPGSTMQQQIDDAYRLYKQDLANGGTGFGDWGEGRLYNGKPFGALGNIPYVAPEGEEFAPVAQQRNSAAPAPSPEAQPEDNGDAYRDRVVKAYVRQLPPELREQHYAIYVGAIAQGDGPGTAFQKFYLAVRDTLAIFTVADEMERQGLDKGLSDEEVFRIAEERVKQGEGLEGALKTLEGIENVQHGTTVASMAQEAAVATGLGAVLRGPGLIANLLGRGNQSIARYLATDAAAEIAGEAGRALVREAGGGSVAQFAAGLGAGAAAGSVTGRIRPAPSRAISGDELGGFHTRPISDLSMDEIAEESRQYGTYISTNTPRATAEAELARLRLQAQRSMFGAGADDIEDARPQSIIDAEVDLELKPGEVPLSSKPLPGQGGLFGDVVDDSGAIKTPPPELGSQRPEFRGEQGGMQGGMFGAEVEPGAQGYAPRLGETPPVEATLGDRLQDLLKNDQELPLDPGDATRLNNLHNSRLRSQGWTTARDAEARAFLSNLATLAQKYAPDADLAPAMQRFEAGDFGSISYEVEPVLTQVHYAMARRSGQLYRQGVPLEESPTTSLSTKPREINREILDEGEPPPPQASTEQGSIVERQPVPSADHARAIQLPDVNGMHRDRRYVNVDDIETDATKFQARDHDPGQAYGETRVKQIVNGWDDARFEPPSIVPHPTKDGKWIVFAGHHRTEAWRRVKGTGTQVEVVAVYADVDNAEQLRSLRLLATTDNFGQATPNFREKIRAVQIGEESGQSVEDIAARLRMTASQVDELKDASLLGEVAVDRVVAEPSLEPYIKEIGRGMRVYEIDLADANGLFTRIATGKKNTRPTPGSLRETIDRFGAALRELQMQRDQGALFEAGTFEGIRTGLLGIIDENARILTELERARAAMVRKRNAAAELADLPDATNADRRAIARLTKLAAAEEARLKDLIKQNEDDVSRVLRGEEPIGRMKPAEPEAPTPPKGPDEPIQPPPETPTREPRPFSNDPIDRLINAVRAAGQMRPDLLVRRKVELGRRVARAAEELEVDGLSATDALKAARRRLRGELADPAFALPESLDVETLKERIVEAVTSQEVQFFTGIKAQDGLEKLAQARVPAPNEVEALGEVFGFRLQEAIEELGDIFKVQRQAERVLDDHRIEIILPDGKPVSADTLAEAMRQHIPGVDANHLEIAAERLIDSGRIKAHMGKDGKVRARVGEVDYDALEAAAARHSERLAMEEDDGLPSKVRTIPYQGVPEQLVPPTQDVIGGGTLDDVGGSGTRGTDPEAARWAAEQEPTPQPYGRNQRPDGSLPGQRTAADVGGVRPGDGSTIDVPPVEPIAGLSLEQTKVLGEANRLGLPGDQLVAMRAAADAGATPEQLTLLMRAYEAGPTRPFEITPGTADTDLSMRQQPTTPRMPSAPGPSTYEIPAARPQEGFTLEQTKVLAQASRDGLDEGQLNTLHTLARGDATPEMLDLVRVSLAEKNRLRAAGLRADVDPNASTPGMTTRPNRDEGDQLWLAKDWKPTTPLLTHVWQTLAALPSMPKSIKTFLDRSARLRQGGLLIRHGAQVLDGWKKTEFIAEDAADALKWERRLRLKPGTIPTAEDVMRGVNHGKWAQVRQQSKLAMEDWGPTSRLTYRNEQFMNRYVSKIPGMDMSERSFVVYLNKLRADVFDQTVEMWLRQGKDLTPKRLEDLATYLNSATGRGSLGEFEGAARALSMLWFAPRNLVSRFQVLAQLFDPRTDNLVRMEMAKDLSTFVMGGMTLLALADLSGFAEVEWDPRSADFGKIKIGPTRIDFWTGYQQMARYTAQIITGEAKSATGEIYDVDRLDVAARYLRNKLSPSGGLGVSVLEDQDFRGQDFELLSLDTVRDLFAPLFLDDLYESIKLNGVMGLAYAPLSYYGVATQTYRTPADERNEARDAESMEKWGVPYKDLPTRYPGSGFSKQAEINETPEVATKVEQARQAYQSTSFGDDSVAIEALRTEMDGREAEAIADWKRGDLLKPLPEIWSDLSKERAGERRAIEALTDDNFRPDEFDQLLDGYFGQQVMQSGVVDWEQTILAQERYLARLPRDDRARMEDWLGVSQRRRSPEWQEYRGFLDAKEKAGYYADGISTTERNELDRQNPELDVQAWRFWSGVEDPEHSDPVLQSAEAVNMALEMDLPKRDVKFEGFGRPINENDQSVAAWQSSGAMLAQVNTQLVPDLQEPFAQLMYEKPFDQLTDSERGAVTSRIRTQAREDMPQLDAWMAWWGVTETLRSPDAMPFLNAIVAEFGFTPPKPDWSLKIAE